MSEVMTKTSKYVKPAKEQKVFESAAVLFLFTLFVVPQYFGIRLFLFDLTLLRLMVLLITFMIFADSSRKNDFAALIWNAGFTKVMLFYLVVITYTMVLRADINAFLNPVIEIFTFYLLIYIIKYVLGVDRVIYYLICFTYLLCVLGMVEYVMGKSPFSYLETIEGIYTGQFVRSGHYRIMGPGIHSLGYGLQLISIAPFICIDLENKKVDFLMRPALLILISTNVLLTGSRSTLVVFSMELCLLLVFQNKVKKKELFLKIIIIFISAALLLGIFYKTSIAQYVMLQLTTMVDEIFGTAYSDYYGASKNALSDSSDYREQLKYIFTLDWLNPILGIGRMRSFSVEMNDFYIHSIDNFYIAEYIRYAYPGLLAYIFFVGYFVCDMLKKIVKTHGAICKILLIGSVCYLINLFWMDSLQTLKYLYILFAVFWCVDDHETAKTETITMKYIGSRYVRG